MSEKTKETTDPMMQAFTEIHGQMSDYPTKEEKDMYLSWLGSFYLGWKAYQKWNDTHHEATGIRE